MGVEKLSDASRPPVRKVLPPEAVCLGRSVPFGLGTFRSLRPLGLARKSFLLL